MINRFYYSVCSEIERSIYTKIWEGLSVYKEVISFDGGIAMSDTVSKVFKMVLYDNPRIFYTSTQGYLVGHVGHNTYLKPKYFFSLNAVLELQNWLDERIEEICSPVRFLDDDFAKEIFIYNYLIENVNYSTSAVSQPINAYTVAGTLLENNSVCAGVALSFKLLMDYLEIPCIVATGVATNSVGHTEKHAWNIVNIEGAYYQADITWDLLGETKGRVIKYDYFNLTSKDMYLSRLPDYEYPTCVHQEYNYFYFTNAIVRTVSELREFVSEKVFNGETYIYFKYLFDFYGMKENITFYLSDIQLLGRYMYWTNEIMHTVYILRNI